MHAEEYREARAAALSCRPRVADFAAFDAVQARTTKSRIPGTPRCACSSGKMQGALAAVLAARTRPLAANLSTRPPSARPCPSRPGASPPQPRSQMPPPPPALPPPPPMTASSPSPAPSAAGALVAAARRLSSARRASQSSTNLARVAHVYFKCVRYEAPVVY